MIDQISIRFYEELNDFLSSERRKCEFITTIKERGSIKDLVESLGVPHTEVDLILVNGVSVDFSYLVRPGDHISVYPVFEAIDITPLVHLRPAPLRKTRFVLDSHLGRLAAYLRMLGFDSLYRNDYEDAILANISAQQKRILLTCDRRLLMRKIITHGYFVRSRQPHEQVIEVLQRLDLFNNIKPFTRCMHCNGLIQSVDKKAIEANLLPLTRQHYDTFSQCLDCRKIYWKGSHFQSMLLLVDKFRNTRRSMG